jgi:D-amino-acid dehydrogenase
VFALGHGFFGLIGAATTGRLVADLIARKASAIDLSPYRVDRF